MAKIKTLEAARRLGIHPANLILRLSEMVGSLEECWPEVDEGLVETLETMDHIMPPAPQPEPQPADAGLPSLSKSAREVLSKLDRKKRYGRKNVKLETLKNHFCQGVDGLEEAIEELKALGLIQYDGKKKGTYHLDPGRKDDIQKYLAEYGETLP